MPEYVVVCRAEAGVRIGKRDPIYLRQYPSPLGPVDILLQSRLTPWGGFSKPVLRGLMAEIRGEAPSLDAALQEFSKTVQWICPIFAFIANSTVEDMVPEIGYEVTPDVTERDFFQHFLPEERFLTAQRRRISSDLFTNILHVLQHHPEAERLRRATGQYYQALRYWEPGQDVLAIAHLWMAVEALTPVVLRRVISSENVDRDRLAAKWDISIKHLDAEVRRRVIFAGDLESYSRAREASDGFEHGYLGFSDIFEHSRAVKSRVAAHVRAAILRELNLDDADADAIRSPTYATPGHTHEAKYVRGKLVGESRDLAAPGEAYPRVAWITKYVEQPNESAGEMTIQIQEQFTGVFAPGLSLQIQRIESWGGQESTLKPRTPNSGLS